MKKKNIFVGLFLALAAISLASCKAKVNKTTTTKTDPTTGVTTPTEPTTTIEPTMTEVIILKHVSAKNATCTTNGNIEYWVDEVHNKYYSDSEGLNEITLDDTIILGHHDYEKNDLGDHNIHVCKDCSEKVFDYENTYFKVELTDTPTIESSGFVKISICTLVEKDEYYTFDETEYTSIVIPSLVYGTYIPDKINNTFTATVDDSLTEQLANFFEDLDDYSIEIISQIVADEIKFEVDSVENLLPYIAKKVEYKDAKSYNEPGNYEYWYIDATDKYYTDKYLYHEATYEEVIHYFFRISDNVKGYYYENRIIYIYEKGNLAAYFDFTIPTETTNGVINFLGENLTSQYAITLDRLVEDKNEYDYNSTFDKFTVKASYITSKLVEKLGDENSEEFAELSAAIVDTIGLINTGYSNQQTLSSTAATLETKGSRVYVDLTEGYIHVIEEDVIVAYAYTISVSEDDTYTIIKARVSKDSFKPYDYIDILKKDGTIATANIEVITTNIGNLTGNVIAGDTCNFYIYKSYIKAEDVAEAAIICEAGYGVVSSHFQITTTKAMSERTNYDVFIQIYDEYVYVGRGRVSMVVPGQTKICYIEFSTPKILIKNKNVNLNIINGGSTFTTGKVQDKGDRTVLRILPNECGHGDAFYYYDTNSNITLPTQSKFQNGSAKLIGFSTTPNGEVVYEPGESFKTASNVSLAQTLYAIWDEDYITFKTNKESVYTISGVGVIVTFTTDIDISIPAASQVRIDFYDTEYYKEVLVSKTSGAAAGEIVSLTLRLDSITEFTSSTTKYDIVVVKKNN